VSNVAAEPLEAGRDALRRHAWREGYELLASADTTASLSPEDLEGLAAAAWWTGRLEACISARERAFAGYIAAENQRRAALVAMALAKDYYAKRAASIGTAWLTRAERLLAEESDCVEQGYLARLLAVIAFESRGDFDAALAHGRHALEIGTRFADRELQALGLQDQGRALVAKGDVAEGMAMIEEATSAAVSGELSPYYTGVIYCNMISACGELADYRRAGDWSEAATRWCERQAIEGFPGVCRVYRASIMLIRGAWSDAEREARRACDELIEFNLDYAAEAFYELGEIRSRKGDLAAAREAFRQSHGLGRDPQPGLALLRLAEGRIDGACAGIEQALNDESRALRRARLLPAQVEIAIAASDLAKAHAAAEELTATARTFGSDALEAAALTARARIALTEGNPRLTVREGRQALRLWQQVGAPFEAAEARVLLGSAHAEEGTIEDGVLELQAAVSAFDQLGAALAARRAREQLGSLGIGPTAVDAKNLGGTRTFVFTDIARSTNLVEAIGDEAWADLVRWHDGTLRSLFAEHGGEEIDHAGDGFFVAFVDTTAAVECAVAVQRTLAAHRRAHGFAPQVRIGIHASEAVRDGAHYRGKGVHQAARISAVATGGEVLASAATVEGASVRFPTFGERVVELKGVSEPVAVVTVGWQT
jgi:class 3 adenylate cyclase/tetratricopeptide (TPR) repeat protein